jgi:hypothetical protein
VTDDKGVLHAGVPAFVTETGAGAGPT